MTAGLVCLPCAGTPSSAAPVPTTVLRLVATTDAGRAVAELRVPRDWRASGRSASGVTLSALTRSKRCTHRIVLRARALPVAESATAGAWADARLKNVGPMVAVGGVSPAAFRVAKDAQAAKRNVARMRGIFARTGDLTRHGRLLGELAASSTATRGCPRSEGAKVGRRLARLLAGVQMTVTVDARVARQ